MTAVPMLGVERRWECPNRCGHTEVTRRADAHTQLHGCRLMHGLMVPLVEAGTRAKAELVVRQDVVGDADGLRYVDGDQVVRSGVTRRRSVRQVRLPVQSVVVTTDRTQSVVVFPEAARARLVDIDDHRFRERNPRLWRVLTRGFRSRFH